MQYLYYIDINSDLNSGQLDTVKLTPPVIYSNICIFTTKCFTNNLTMLIKINKSLKVQLKYSPRDQKKNMIFILE